MNPISILLVDDHEVVRTGLKSFLNTQESMQVVAEASSGEEALERYRDEQPNVVVMDISMPGMDGLEATRQLREKYPECRVLALTIHEDKQYLFEMMASGASGYITKNSAGDELVAAIHAIASDNIYLQPTLARWLLEDYRRLQTQAPKDMERPGEESARGKDLDVLSKRETQVLELVAEGLTNVLIGEKLGISPKTVARHRERIMNKLDLHSSTELVKFAIRTGLIELG